MRSKLRRQCHTELTAQASPKFSSQSNPSDNAIGIVQANFRRLRGSAESKLGVRIWPDTALYKWIVRHAGWVATHLRVLASGSTPFREVYGHSYTRELATIGDAVLARLPRAK